MEAKDFITEEQFEAIMDAMEAKGLSLPEIPKDKQVFVSFEDE